MGIDEDRGSVQYTRRKYSKDVNLDSGMIVRIVRKFCRRFLKKNLHNRRRSYNLT